MAKKLNDKKLQEKIGWEPFEEQEEIIDAYYDAKDIVLVAGTRWGKSAVSAYFAFRELMKSNRHIWIVSPSYSLSDKVFQYIVEWLGNGFAEDVRNGTITKKKRPPSGGGPEIKNKYRNSWIRCKSAENPEGMLGEEIDLVVMDECSRISEDVWQSYIRQRLTSRDGKSVKISTPFGQNWFFKEFQRVKEAEDGFAAQYRSVDSPYFEEEQWEREKKNTPERIFQQEYQASFLPDAASVFRHPQDCIKGNQEDYDESHEYVIGVDLGRYEDYTVITVMDRMTNHLVYFDRFKGIDWELQKKRIVAVNKQYGNPVTFIDSTAVTVGDAYVRELSDSHVNVRGYKMSSNIKKRQLVEKLSVMIDQRQITYPDIDALMSELKSFGYELTSSGNVRYQAPEGMHDDAVIALALACWDLREETLEPKEEGNENNVITYPNQEY